MRKKVCFLMFLLLIIIFSGISYSAPYRNYNYNFHAEIKPGPQAYLPQQIIDGERLGLGEFRNPSDIFVDNEDNIYLLDTGNDRIIILDEQLNLQKIIDSFEKEGNEETFSSPQGIYVTDTGSIFIADTDNARVIELNKEGDLKQTWGRPKSGIEDDFLEDMRYRPIKIVASPRVQRVFVIARHVIEGILEFDMAGNFRGFVGAPEVDPSPVDVIWRTFSTAAQRERMELILPTQYTSMDIDERGFKYATENNEVRLLNLVGQNIIRATGFFEPIGDIIRAEQPGVTARKIDENEGAGAESAFIDVVSRKHGMYSALDRQRGKIFTYDETGNLLYVFGTKADIKGGFRTPRAIDTIGENNIVVLDRRRGWFTIFEPTVYAELIHSAVANYREGDHESSFELWEKAANYNVNNHIAYSNMGILHYYQGNYEESLNYLKIAENRERYSRTFRDYRQTVIEENINKIIFLILSIFLFSGIYIKYSANLVEITKKKINKKSIIEMGKKSAYFKKTMDFLIRLFKSLRYSLHVVFHPADGFWRLKNEGKGTIPGSVVLLILVIVTFIFTRQYTGFIFNPRDLSRINIYREMLSILIPFSIWCAVNWSLTTLMDGKGTIKNIFIASAFALTPIILLNVPLTVISNYMTLQEGGFFYLIQAISIFWMIGLLILGTMVTHEYTLTKTLLTLILIIVGMGLVIFIGLLFIGLLNLLFNFAGDIYTEVFIRQ